jgi:hypothetical protein
MSASLALWVVPHLAWSVKGTPVSLRDIASAAAKPFLAAALAGLPSWAIAFVALHDGAPITRLAAGVLVFAVTYLSVLLFAMRQWPLYLDLLSALKHGGTTMQGAR